VTCASMYSVSSVKRCCKKARLGNSSSITFATEALLEDFQYREECGEKVGLGFNLPMPKPVLFGLRGPQNEENVVAASRHLTPICRGKWRSLGEDI